MIKTITKIGNSQGIIFDAAIMELAHLNVGDKVNLEVHEGGTITLMAVRESAPKEKFRKTLKGVLRDYRDTLHKLS